MVLLSLVACNRDGVAPAVSRGVKEMKAGPLVYVALGDSTGSGVGASNGGYVARLFKRLLDHRAGSELLNLCVSGATTEDVLRRQLQSGVERSPDLITVGIGINDIGHGFPVEEFAKNYDQILSTLKEKTRAEIVVTNIPDVSSAPRIPASMRAEYQRQIERFNERLEEIARRHEVTIFDVFTITRRELSLHPEYFSGDGFHPSDKGYELWAEQMWPTMAGVIGAS
ncbi:MAG TPA: SGNH/GDSL hydrolase family protein [Pyrinomonadaceae bacterium]|nr:SGNH/GDSL hydrolase family protein [Pyrinomonadaceae bacterium]